MAWNVVIAGGGFGGAMAARELERIMPRQSTRLVLINDANFMLYTPLLPEAAAGTIEPRHVTVPLRTMSPHADLLLGSVTALDTDAKLAHVSSEAGTFAVSYERLVIALGTSHQLGLARQRRRIERQPVGRIAARTMLFLVGIAPADQAFGDLGLDMLDALGATARQRAAGQDLLGGIVELAQ